MFNFGSSTGYSATPFFYFKPQKMNKEPIRVTVKQFHNMSIYEFGSLFCFVPFVYYINEKGTIMVWGSETRIARLANMLINEPGIHVFEALSLEAINVQIRPESPYFERIQKTFPHLKLTYDTPGSDEYTTS